MPDFNIESTIDGIVAGVDEVGRGPWAGPVTACAVIINREAIPLAIIPLIDDSKKLKKANREQVHAILTALPIDTLCYSIGHASVEEIDKINIRQSTLLAMSRAIAGLSITPDHCLVDGNVPPAITIPVTTVVGGDAKSLSIAAASIIAKVERDRLMAALAKDFPHYSWKSNVGYGTKAHQAAIHTHGICIHHRKSFKPVYERMVSDLADSA